MGQDLFTYQGDQALERNAPLAERLRPRTIDEFVGQDAILAEGRLLRRAIAADRVGNLLLHGPPGVGKTTLARIIAAHACAHCSVLNAVLAGVKDLREEVFAARKRLDLHGLRTILFIDEVHRFNSAQQDALLPWVENGTVSLIGATTENPYFEVNKALVSRSRLFRLQPLESKDLHSLLKRALDDQERGYGNKQVVISQSATAHLVDVSNGDARTLLNALELAVESTLPDSSGIINIDLFIAEESIQERAVLYDKQGDAHFDTISAFIKSLRGSDPDAALFWLARMVEAGENPRFIFRRMLIAASEDVGLADPQAIVIVEACAAAFERIGLPEGLYSLAQAALYLASTDKSNSVLGFFEAQKIVREAQRQEVPSHLRDAHRDGKAFGDGIGYRYPHAFAEHWVSQQYLPKSLQGEVFWKPSHMGWEGKRRFLMLERRAAQLAAAVESGEEHPLLLSSGPETPELERWLQRQLTNEGDRLQFLLERLWSDVPWKRHQRVLVLGGRSVFWAVNPLRFVPEGGVTIACKSSQDEARLAAQLDLLDSLMKPQLINESCKAINQLPEDLKFEWIGGRLHSQDLEKKGISDLWKEITLRCTSSSGIRLLISFPAIGPAQSLKKILSGQDIENDQLLESLIKAEKKLLALEHKEGLLSEILVGLGWNVKWEQWEESLSIYIDEYLEHRWLDKGRKYRIILEQTKIDNAAEKLQKLLRCYRGKELSQKLIHKKLIASR